MSDLGQIAGAPGRGGSRPTDENSSSKSLGPRTISALAEWNTAVGDVLRSFDSEDLLGTLIDALSYRTRFDSWLAAIFHANAQPTLIDYKESSHKEKQATDIASEQQESNAKMRAIWEEYEQNI